MPGYTSSRQALSACLCVLIALVSVLPAGAAPYHPALDENLFPVPAELIPAVEFWKGVFAEHSDYHSIIHDEVEMDIIYEIVDHTDIETNDSLSETQKRKQRRARVEDRKDHIARILRALAGSGTMQAPAHEVDHIRQLWVNKPGGNNRYLLGAQQLRSQKGLRDTFGNAIKISGMFMPGIEEVLRAEGLPLEIRCMPFVESMFNYKARSKVGASGAWQFTASTGRLYLKINSTQDQRSDVFIAAGGAARLLKHNYKKLGAWPLALTAYNHGAAGIARAVRKTGTRDIGYIARNYRSRTFGFASRNFYASFVAAVIAFHDRKTYFPGIEPLPPLSFETYELPMYVNLPQLVKESGFDTAAMKELNPALRSNVWSGAMLAPKGYPLRVPTGQLGTVVAAWDRVSDRRAAQIASGYRVRSGDTLGTIARRFGTSARAIQNANGLANAHRIYVGQRLIIPGASGSATATARATSASSTAEITTAPRQYLVKSGDSASSIASRFGVTVRDLVANNGNLTDPDRLRVGQKLLIPPGKGSGREYVVVSGDSLFQIAERHQTTVKALRALNRLNSNVIHAGQTLLIP